MIDESDNFFTKYQSRILPLMNRDNSDAELDANINAARQMIRHRNTTPKMAFMLRLQLEADLHMRLERDLEKFLEKAAPERRAILLQSMTLAFRSKKNAAWGKEFAERLEAKFSHIDAVSQGD